MARVVLKGEPTIFEATNPDNPEAPKSIRMRFDFGEDPVWNFDAYHFKEMGKFQSLRAVYFDLSECPDGITINFGGNGQSMKIKGGKQGYRPVLSSGNMNATILGGTGVATIHFLNYFVPPYEWDVNVTIPTSDVIFSASPRLLGRYSAGGGQGEEILLGAPFSITVTPGTLDLVAGGTPLNRLVNASAQYQLIGRTTAGAGAWEDVTRLQLQLAGLPDANVFTASQSVNTNSAAAPPDIIGRPSLLHLTGPDGTLNALLIDGFGFAPGFYGRRSDGTNAAKIAVATGVGLMVLGGGGYDGVAYYSLAVQIAGLTTENWGVGANGARLGFYSTLNGTSVLAARFYVHGGFYSQLSSGDLGIETINVSGVVRHGSFTVGTLPAAATVGQFARAGVTDANGPVFGAAVVGGGAAIVPVYSTGAAWNVG